MSAVARFVQKVIALALYDSRKQRVHHDELMSAVLVRVNNASEIFDRPFVQIVHIE